MASPDVPPTPRPAEGASPHSSTSRSRTVHSRQMSSLSMNTLTTTSQSHHPAESLLHSRERTMQPSQHSPRPDPSYVGCRLRFLLVDIPLDRRRRTTGRVPMCDAYADGVCSRAHSCLSWVSHHWLVSGAVKLTQHRRFLGILHNGSLLHRIQGLSGPSIRSATPWYLFSSLCPFSDSSRHVLYSAIPYHRATSSITIPEHITSSSSAISPLVFPLCTNYRQCCPCLRLEKCRVWLEPAWSMPLES